MDTKKKTDKKPKKKSALRMLIKFLLKLSVIAALFAGCWMYLLRPVYSQGNRMYPAIRDGDMCAVYQQGDFPLGTPVAYVTPDGEERFGRICAVAGDTVDFLDDGGYTVNGGQPSEEVVYPTYLAQNSKIRFPLEVPKDSYFILNDFRSDTDDSRSFGCISKENVVGKVVFLFRRRGF